MAIHAGVGSSNNQEDSFQAGFDAYTEALGKMKDNDVNLVIVFASITFDQKEVVRGVREASGGKPLVGCSTAGEITNGGPTKQSVSVMALSAPDLDFVVGVGNDLKEDSRKAGQEMAGEVKKNAGEELQLLMTFMDSLSGNGSEVVQGALDTLGKHFVIVGGGAGDDARYKETYQYVNDDVISNAVVGTGFVGNFKYSVGVKHGWVPVGIPMKVTRSEGGVLHEVDGKPAIQIYEDYFGAERAEKLKEKTLAELALSYPLGIQVLGSDELLLRAPFFVDAKGSITCGGAVPEGSEVRLMVGSSEEAIAAARAAAERALEQLGSEPKAVLIFNCHVRDKLFGEKASLEINAIQDVLGRDVPLIGFYTYAEQAPLAGEVRNIEACQSEFHNETVVIFMLGE